MKATIELELGNEVCFKPECFINWCDKMVDGLSSIPDVNDGCYEFQDMHPNRSFTYSIDDLGKITISG